MGSNKKGMPASRALDKKHARSEDQSSGHGLYTNKTDPVGIDLFSLDPERCSGQQVGFKRCSGRNLPWAVSGLVLMSFLYPHLHLEPPSPLFVPLVNMNLATLRPSVAFPAYLCSLSIFVFPMCNLYYGLGADGPKALIGLTTLAALACGFILGATELETFLLVLPAALILVMSAIVFART